MGESNSFITPGLTLRPARRGQSVFFGRRPGVPPQPSAETREIVEQILLEHDALVGVPGVGTHRRALIGTAVLAMATAAEHNGQNPDQIRETGEGALDLLLGAHAIQGGIHGE